MNKLREYTISYLSILCLLLCFHDSKAQGTEHKSVDSLFKDARKQAFSGRRADARKTIDTILQISPTYNEVKVFLARINIWDGKYDTATSILNDVLNSDPNNEEAIDASIDLNYWSDKINIANDFADRGLSINNKSDRFHYKKAKIQVYNKDNEAALAQLDTFLKINPDTSSNKQSRSLRDTLVKHRFDKGVDDLFKEARNYAFNGNRPQARILIDSILKRSPNYMDVYVFLARINTWDSKYDTAERTLRWVLSKDSTNLEALNAIIDLKYWANQPWEAESYATKALRLKPKSDDLHVKKAKAQVDQKKYKDAADMLDSFIQHHPDSSTSSKMYRKALRDEMIHNSLSLSYDLDYFTPKNSFSAPWHLVSLYYSRQTPIGTVIGRVNYANRFTNINGVQYEIDAYPSIARKTYMYLNAGYSAEEVVFPRYRWGASIYRNLPWSLEIEVGIRVLYFAPRLGPVDIFTGSIGKYYGKFWFSLRPFITPGDYGVASKSFMFITRYYPRGTADNYWTLSLSRGFSPDEHSKDYVLVSRSPLLNAYKIKLDRNFLINSRTVLNLRTALEDDQLPYSRTRFDYTFGFTLERRF